MRIGIMGAMPQEIAMLKKHITDQTEEKVNEFVTVWTGKYAGHDIVFAAANVGMVFASSVATILVVKYNVEEIVFTGVAGALLDSSVKVGHIVIGSEVVNYDMNCTAFKLAWDPEYVHKRGELPFIPGFHVYEGDKHLIELAQSGAPKTGSGVEVHVGRIVTGSEFVTAERRREMKALWEEMGNPLAVEMECAAVAQVCKSFAVPFLGLRAISDTADGDANDDFNAFCQQAADNLWPMLEHIITNKTE